MVDLASRCWTSRLRVAVASGNGVTAKPGRSTTRSIMKREGRGGNQGGVATPAGPRVLLAFVPQSGRCLLQMIPCGEVFRPYLSRIIES